MLLNNSLPEYQINEVHTIEIQASIRDVYRAILDSPFIMGSLIFRILLGLRELPSKLFGKGEEVFPKESMNLTDFLEKSNFVLIAHVFHGPATRLIQDYTAGELFDINTVKYGYKKKTLSSAGCHFSCDHGGQCRIFYPYSEESRKGSP